MARKAFRRGLWNCFFGPCPWEFLCDTSFAMLTTGYHKGKWKGSAIIHFMLNNLLRVRSIPPGHPGHPGHPEHPEHVESQGTNWYPAPPEAPRHRKLIDSFLSGSQPLRARLWRLIRAGGLVLTPESASLSGAQAVCSRPNAEDHLSPMRSRSIG